MMSIIRSSSLAALLVFTSWSAAHAQPQTLGTPFGTPIAVDGVMFDLAASTTVFIRTFNVRLAAGTWNIEFRRVTAAGSYQGLENVPSAWTLIASVNGVVSAGPGVATPIATLLNVPMIAGGTQGFYVTATNGPGVLASAGTMVGNVLASNSSLAILEGASNSYPFGGFVAPRALNGGVSYKTQGCQLGNNININSGSLPPQPVPIPRNTATQVSGTVTDSVGAGTPVVWSWFVGKKLTWGIGTVAPLVTSSFTHTWTALGSGPTQDITLVVWTVDSQGEVLCDGTTVVTVCVYENFVAFSAAGIASIEVHATDTACFPWAVSGYTLVSFDTTHPPGAGPLFGLTIDLHTLLQELTVPAAPGNPIHFIVDGVNYPDAPFILPPGALPIGLQMDLVEVLLDATTTPRFVSGVSRVTVQ